MFRKSLAQKLLFRKDAQVLLVNEPPDFGLKLGSIPSGVKFVTELTSRVDLICLFTHSHKDLEWQMPSLVSALNDDGVLWVFCPINISTVDQGINCEALAQYAGRMDLESVSDFSIDAQWAVHGFQYKPLNIY